METIYAQLDSKNLTLEQSQELNYSCGLNGQRSPTSNSQQGISSVKTGSLERQVQLIKSSQVLKKLKVPKKQARSTNQSSPTLELTPYTITNDKFADCGQTTYANHRDSSMHARDLESGESQREERGQNNRRHERWIRNSTSEESSSQGKGGCYKDKHLYGTVIHPLDEYEGNASSDSLNIKTDTELKEITTKFTKGKVVSGSKAKQGGMNSAGVEVQGDLRSRNQVRLKTDTSSTKPKSMNSGQKSLGKSKDKSESLIAILNDEASKQRGKKASTSKSDVSPDIVLKGVKGKPSKSMNLLKSRFRPQEFPMSKTIMDSSSTPGPNLLVQKKTRSSKSTRQLLPSSGSSSSSSSHSNDDEVSEDEDYPLTRPNKKLAQGMARPFPMSPSCFSHKPPSASSITSSSRYSLESDDCHNFAGKLDLSKGKNVETESSRDEPGGLAENDLCPFCDMPFPPKPSSYLQSMLSSIIPLSYPESRPTNKNGRKAPLLTYLNMCQRHNFEYEQLPAAEAAGWPTEIDFSALPKRVRSMRAHLGKIVSNKETSIFWKELKAMFKDKGVRSVMGLSGQFNSFEKCLPGYYGEQGSIIIFETLSDLFPPESMDIDAIAPLSPEQFLQNILIPETAIRLIQADKKDRGIKKVSLGEALTTLRESSKYGIAMFPDFDNREGPSICMPVEESDSFKDSKVLSKSASGSQERSRRLKRETSRQGKRSEKKGLSDERIVERVDDQRRNGQAKKGRADGKNKQRIVMSSSSEAETAEPTPRHQIKRDTKGKKRCSDAEDYFDPASSPKRMKGGHSSSSHVGSKVTRKGTSEVTDIDDEDSMGKLPVVFHKAKRKAKKKEGRSVQKMNSYDYIFKRRDNGWLLNDSSAPSSSQ